MSYDVMKWKCEDFAVGCWLEGRSCEIRDTYGCR